MAEPTRPSILMLGTDRYAMRACIELDIDAVVVCGPGGRDNDFVPVPAGLRTLPVDDQGSVEAILMALHRAGLAGHRFTGIQTTDEWALVTGSVLAQQLGCDFLDPTTAVHFRDKSLQKARVRSAGVCAAQVTLIDDIHDVSSFDTLPYPRAVLKPVAGAGTVRTTVLDCVEELRACSARYRKEQSKERTFVLEEHIAGDEWVADGVVFDGDLLFTSIGTYANPCVTTVGGGLPLSIRRFDPERDAAPHDAALPVVRTALAALGLRNGVFHMELFHDPDSGKLTFSECAARRGGALVHEELQAKFGVSLGKSAVLCAAGRRPDLTVKIDRRVIGGGFLMGRPGTLLSCPTPADLRALPGVLFARIERPFGTHIGEVLAGTNSRLGMCLLATETAEAFYRRLAEVQAWFEERTIVLPEKASTLELRAWQRATWPDADFSDTVWGQ